MSDLREDALEDLHYTIEKYDGCDLFPMDFGMLKRAADEIASLRAQLAKMAREHDAYYAKLTGEYFDKVQQLASARKALERIAAHDGGFCGNIAVNAISSLSDEKGKSA